MKTIPQLLVTLLIISSSLNAQVYVDASATGDNNGTSWANAYNNLNDALSLTTASDIWIAEGEYKPTQIDTATYYKLGAAHNIYGGFQSGDASLSDRDPENNITLLNGDIAGNDDPSDISVNKDDNAVHLIYIDDQIGHVMIDGVHFRNGTALTNNDNGESNFQLRGGAIYSLSPLSLNNCSFESNTALSGSAVYILQADEGAIANCTFTKNFSTSQAGGLMLATCSGVSVSDCTFEDNDVNRGALYTLQCSDIDVSDCFFVNNTVIPGAFGSGGYFNWQSVNINLTDCWFEGNVSENAGAIYSDGREISGTNQLNLTRCQFLNNNVANFGGAVYIYEGQAILSSCVFENNNANNAGAMYIDNSIASITDCFYVNNRSNGFGGGLYAFEGSYDCHRNTFTGNNANNAGGAYFRAASVDIEECSWTNNVAESSMDDETPFGAGLYISLCTYEMRDCNFTGNISDYSAGGLYSASSTYVIRNSNFVSNLATFGAGCLNYNEDNAGKYENCSFLSNQSFTSGAGAGVGFQAAVEFEGCIFSLNNADFGAGLFAQNNETSVSIKSCEFRDNSVANTGGAMSASASIFVNIENTLFSENSGDSGGALNYGADSLRVGGLNIDKCIFENNVAFTQGGAINLFNVNMGQISSSLFYSNEAQGGAGGAIINNGFDINEGPSNSSLHLVNNTIADNNSGLGAGIAQFQSGSSTANISFLNNILFNFNGLDYEVEGGNPTTESLGGNLSVYAELSNIFNATNDVVQVDPSFVDQLGRDYRLNNGSPAIDSGVDAGAHETDLDGLPIMGTVDKGCYENQMSTSTSNLLDIQGISLLQNPTSDRIAFEIESAFQGAVRVTLINTMGQNVSQHIFNKVSGRDIFEFNVSDLNPGQYFLMFQMGNVVGSKKVVLN